MEKSGRKRSRCGATSQYATPACHACDRPLEAEAVTRLEFIRIVTRVAPKLGLVATMIPMGPALKALGEGQLSDVAHSLMVAFSAVILALIASSITYAIAHVRRRWYASDLMLAEQGAGVGR